MTKLLQEVVAKLQSLADCDQDAMASLILSELQDEERWQASFASSQEALTRLAEKARQDVLAGKVRQAGFDEL